MKEETGIHGGVAVRRPSNFTGKKKTRGINREEVCFQKLNDAVATYNLCVLHTRSIFIQINMKVGDLRFDHKNHK